MELKVEGFRKPTEDYFNYVSFKKDTHQQTTPFILCKDGVVKEITHISTLLSEAKSDDVVLHAWPGQWRTDVFAFKMSEFLDYRKSHNIL